MTSQKSEAAFERQDTALARNTTDLAHLAAGLAKRAIEQGETKEAMTSTRRSVRRHKGELVVVSVHQYGDAGAYACEFTYDIELSQAARFSETFPSLKDARDSADRRLHDDGHRCDESCTDWQLP